MFVIVNPNSQPSSWAKKKSLVIFHSNHHILIHIPAGKQNDT